MLDHFCMPASRTRSARLTPPPPERVCLCYRVCLCHGSTCSSKSNARFNNCAGGAGSVFPGGRMLFKPWDPSLLTVLRLKVSSSPDQVSPRGAAPTVVWTPAALAEHCPRSRARHLGIRTWWMQVGGFCRFRLFWNLRLGL